jgi:hypothetical protein
MQRIHCGAENTYVSTKNRFVQIMPPGWRTPPSLVRRTRSQRAIKSHIDPVRAAQRHEERRLVAREERHLPGLLGFVGTTVMDRPWCCTRGCDQTENDVGWTHRRQVPLLQEIEADQVPLYITQERSHILKKENNNIEIHGESASCCSTSRLTILALIVSHFAWHFWARSALTI